MPECAICGVQGKAALHDGRDYLCGLGGTWNFSECVLCRSLWLNPAPVEADIPRLYPENYNFTRAANAQAANFPSGFTGSAKLSILQHFYGYSSLEGKADNEFGLVVGRFLGFLLLGKAGHSIRFLKHIQPGKLLDVGCGNGDFMLWMQRLGWEVEGIELDPKAAQVALDRGLRVRIDNINNVEIAPESFDAITLSHVAEHFANPLKVFERLAPCLKRGGVLVSISPNPRGILRRWFGNKWYALDPPRHLFIPSGEAYCRMLQPIGFEVKTSTSMRLFHWLFKESLSIAQSRAVGTIKDSMPLNFITTALAALFSCWPNRGEEVVCYATKR